MVVIYDRPTNQSTNKRTWRVAHPIFNYLFKHDAAQYTNPQLQVIEAFSFVRLISKLGISFPQPQQELSDTDFGPNTKIYFEYKKSIIKTKTGEVA